MSMSITKKRIKDILRKTRRKFSAEGKIRIFLQGLRGEDWVAELAWHLTETHEYFISESSVYRILKALDLVTSPRFVMMSAADAFQNPTRRVHNLQLAA